MKLIICQGIFISSLLLINGCGGSKGSKDSNPPSNDDTTIVDDDDATIVMQIPLVRAMTALGMPQQRLLHLPPQILLPLLRSHGIFQPELRMLRSFGLRN